jgi:hypothetical protein
MQDDQSDYLKHLLLLTPDRVPIASNLSEHHTQRLRDILSGTRDAFQIPSKRQGIEHLTAITAREFSLPDELAVHASNRDCSTVKSLAIDAVNDYDEFFRVKRIVSPTPIEAWIRSFLITIIVNWDNADDLLDASLKAGFIAQIDLVARVLDTPEEA